MDMTTKTDAELSAIVSSSAHGYWDREHAKDEQSRRINLWSKAGVEIGDTIDFVRHGKAPTSGKSRNHRDGTTEDGLSVYLLKPTGEVHYVGFSFGIAEKPAYRGRGVVVGFGSDGEPLVEVQSIRRDKSFDR